MLFRSVVGAVVVESIGRHCAQSLGEERIVTILTDNLSEFMESAGMALFAYALLAHLAAQGVELTLKFGGAPAEEPPKPAR
mgnify:FL=1